MGFGSTRPPNRNNDEAYQFPMPNLKGRPVFVQWSENSRALQGLGYQEPPFGSLSHSLSKSADAAASFQKQRFEP